MPLYMRKGLFQMTDANKISLSFQRNVILHYKTNSSWYYQGEKIQLIMLSQQSVCTKFVNLTYMYISGIFMFNFTYVSGKGIGSLVTGKLIEPVTGLGSRWTFRFFGFFSIFILLAYMTIQTVFFRTRSESPSKTPVVKECQGIVYIISRRAEARDFYF